MASGFPEGPCATDAIEDDEFGLQGHVSHEQSSASVLAPLLDSTPQPTVGAAAVDPPMSALVQVPLDDAASSQGSSFQLGLSIFDSDAHVPDSQPLAMPAPTAGSSSPLDMAREWRAFTTNMHAVAGSSAANNPHHIVSASGPGLPSTSVPLTGVVGGDHGGSLVQDAAFLQHVPDSQPSSDYSYIVQPSNVRSTMHANTPGSSFRRRGPAVVADTEAYDQHSAEFSQGSQHAGHLRMPRSVPGSAVKSREASASEASTPHAHTNGQYSVNTDLYPVPVAGAPSSAGAKRKREQNGGKRVRRGAKRMSQTAAVADSARNQSDQGAGGDSGATEASFGALQDGDGITSFKRAAYLVLQEAGEALTAGQITDRAMEAGMLSTKGSTPVNTMSGQLNSDIRKYGSRSLFRKITAGVFEVNESARPLGNGARVPPPEAQ